MKKNKLTKVAFTALLLSSSLAGADQQYPAADFQPEVIYQNSDYIKSTPQTSNNKKVNSTASSESDVKYPAADFQPEVLYHDTEYKNSGTSKTSTSSVAVAQEEASNSGEESSSMSSYLIGLVFLALTGFYLFKKSCGSTNKTKSPQSIRKSYAVNTGVAKYLNKVSGTGVSRYLESHIKTVSAATGVAKYMAKQTASTKETAAKSATGVEKYMRDRG